MMSDKYLTSGTQFPCDDRCRTNEFASTTKIAVEGRVLGCFVWSIICSDKHTQPWFLIAQPAVGELLEEMALTGKLKLCVGEGSAKNLQQCKSRHNHQCKWKRKIEWATAGREQLKKAAWNQREEKEALPTSRFLQIPWFKYSNKWYDNAKRLGIQRSSILQVDNR